MKQVALFLSLGALTVSLSACNPVGLNPSVATPSQAVIAINGFNAAELTAKGVLSLPVCSGTVPAPCRTDAASQSLVRAILTGRAARNGIRSALGNGSSAVPVSLIDTLATTSSTIQTLISVNSSK